MGWVPAVVVIALLAVIILLALDVVQYRKRLSGLGGNVVSQDETIHDMQDEVLRLEEELDQQSDALGEVTAELGQLRAATDTYTPLRRDRTEENHVYYSGSMTLSGSYNMCVGDASGIVTGLCFTSDPETAFLLPRGYAHGEESYDDRRPWFCFSNEAEALALLEVDVPANGCLNGQATVTVTDYVANILQGEAWDTARLLRVEN